MSNLFDDLNTAVAGVFGQAVSHTPKLGGGPFEGQGVFDLDHHPVELSDGAVISDRETTISIVDKDWAIDWKKGDQVLINGQSYHLREGHPDAGGMTRWFLRKA